MVDEHTEVVRSHTEVIRSGTNTTVTVTQEEGFFCTVKMRGEVNLPAERVFDVLVHPDNHRIFSAIKDCRKRKILKDDGQGYQLVEVEQLGQWKFLAFKGQFTTSLMVESNRKKGTIDFKLTQPGFMKDFKGKWLINPLLAEEQPAEKPWWQSGPQQWLQQDKGAQAPSSVVTLQQSVLPAFTPPKPLDRLLKGIAAQQIRKIMGDLETEVNQIKRGKSRLYLPWLEDYQN